MTLFFLLLFVTLTIIRTLYHVDVPALSTYLFKMSVQNTLQHLNTTSFAESAFMNYHESTVEDIDMEQAPPANTTASKSIILNTLQIDLNAAVTQAQLLTLHNNFNLLIRDLSNEIYQLVTNLQQHPQDITHSSEPTNFTPSDSNMSNVNGTNWASILNAHVSVTITALKLQYSNKYDRSITNDYAWT